MDVFKFIIILIIILAVLYLFRCRENFQNENTGIFNYFFQKTMNPYSEPLNAFFSNDIVNKIN